MKEQTTGEAIRALSAIQPYKDEIMRLREENIKLRSALKTYAKQCPAVTLYHSNGSIYPSRRVALEVLGELK